MFKKSLCCSLLLALAAAGSSEPKHLHDARELVAEIKPADNKYVYKLAHIHWKGDPGFDHYENHSDCSEFLNLLLSHSYGTTADQLHEWTGHRKPEASHWHDAIIKGKGAKQIEQVADALPGDILAVKFPPGLNDTGHVMMVDAAPVAITATNPIVPGTKQWSVTIIDSTKFPHGPSDTRNPASTGVGRGIIRIYSDSEGKVAGYTWDGTPDAKFREQSDRNLVIGRLEMKSE